MMGIEKSPFGKHAVSAGGKNYQWRLKVVGESTLKTQNMYIIPCKYFPR